MGHETPPKRAETLNVTGLKERGWTDAMIRDLLGEPDELRRNPAYKSAAPMRLYSTDRVLDAESGGEFAARKAAAAARQAKAKAAAARNAADLAAEAEAIVVTVPVISRDDLVRQACDSYNARNGGDDRKGRATPDSDPEFVERITVNYLRHEMTGYERELAARYGKVGVQKAVDVIRDRVYDAIAEAYPDLAAECSRQQDRRDALAGW